MNTTKLSVKALAFGGKFIGQHVGFAQIDIYTTDTAPKLLASGLTNQGLVPGTDGSGITSLIMNQPYPWGFPVCADSATEFSTEIQISEPTVLKFVATSVADPGISVSCCRLVVPGVALSGAMAVVMVLPGLLANLVSPVSDTHVVAGISTPITAQIRMMCGCEIDNLFWPAANFNVTALISSGGKTETVALTYAGQPSMFSQEYTFAEAGTYEIRILATQMNGNTGSTDLFTLQVGAAES